MPDNDALFEVLRRFARTMTGSYDITDVLYELCDHVVDILDATAAGVALFDDTGELRFVTATNEAAVAAERAQEHAQEGPCLSSVQRQRPVVVRDLHEHSEQWPHFCKIADSEGFRAVIGLPLVLGDERVGSLDVYQRGSRDWPEELVAAATVLADIAAAYVLNASELARSRRTAEQLQHALDSRVAIEQAKGKMAGQANISLNEAFEAIRAHARSNHLTVRSVAQAVLDEGIHVVTGGEQRQPAS